ncbi:MAG: hypothetical protein H8D80_00075, partial [Proteobacteria bacterium]|nr:hypothetical protein [Pseudomonadota bacterium]
RRHTDVIFASGLTSISNDTTAGMKVNTGDGITIRNSSYAINSDTVEVNISSSGGLRFNPLGELQLALSKDLKVLNNELTIDDIDGGEL